MHVAMKRPRVGIWTGNSTGSHTATWRDTERDL
jgi:hypothetical protein